MELYSVFLHVHIAGNKKRKFNCRLDSRAQSEWIITIGKSIRFKLNYFKSKKEDILQLYIKLCVLFNLNLQYL